MWTVCVCVAVCVCVRACVRACVVKLEGIISLRDDSLPLFDS